MFVILYAIISGFTLACALGLLLSPRADHGAFWLMGAMFGIAANFLLMSQELLAFVQIIVYVGAVMVLFLFVIMLLNLRRPEPNLRESITPAKGAAYFLSASAIGLILFAFSPASGELVEAISPKTAQPSEPFDREAAREVAVELLTTWIYPFEIVSLLLLAAVVGAVIIARRRPILMIDAGGEPPVAPTRLRKPDAPPAPARPGASPSGRLSRG